MKSLKQIKNAHAQPNLKGNLKKYTKPGDTPLHSVGWWVPGVWQGLCEDPAVDSQEPGSAGMWGWVRSFQRQTHCPSRNAQKGKEREKNGHSRENSSVLLPDYYSISSNCILKCSVGKKNAKSLNKLKASLLFNLWQVFKKSCWGHPAQKDVVFADEGN